MTKKSFAPLVYWSRKSSDRELDRALPRGKHVDLRSARGRSNSSQRWLRRQLNDPYVRRSHAEKYRSRAAYKLLEINDKFSVFAQAKHVVDIGCAPGGWLQVTQKLIPYSQAKLVGVDILPTDPLERATILCGDAREHCVQQQIWHACAGEIDVVLSDMAAPMIGHAATDQINVAALAETAWRVAEVILKQSGHFVCKVYAGGAEQDLLQQLKKHFARVKHFKPRASRAESREIYLVALSRQTMPTLQYFNDAK